jgi:hypothetical protein
VPHWVPSFPATVTAPRALFWVAWLVQQPVHILAAAQTVSASTKTLLVSVTQLPAHKRTLRPKADDTSGPGNCRDLLPLCLQ